MKFGDMIVQMEKKYGKTIAEIMGTIPIEQLEVEEMVVLMEISLVNHLDALNYLTTRIATLEARVESLMDEMVAPFSTEIDEGDPAFA